MRRVDARARALERGPTHMTARARRPLSVALGLLTAIALPAAAAAQTAPATRPAAQAPAQTPNTPRPAAGTGTAATGLPIPTDYVVGPDDILSIVFWRDADMTQEVTVRPDGNITLPLLGDIKAAGLKPSELRDQIAKTAGKFIEDPNVTVVVRQINSRNVFITGGVTRPGAVPGVRPDDRAAADHRRRRPHRVRRQQERPHPARRERPDGQPRSSTTTRSWTART